MKSVDLLAHHEDIRRELVDRREYFKYTVQMRDAFDEFVGKGMIEYSAVQAGESRKYLMVTIADGKKSVVNEQAPRFRQSVQPEVVRIM